MHLHLVRFFGMAIMLINLAKTLNDNVRARPTTIIRCLRGLAKALTDNLPHNDHSLPQGREDLLANIHRKTSSGFSKPVSSGGTYVFASIHESCPFELMRPTLIEQGLCV